MPAAASFDYAVIRLVPHVERGEFVNVGIILFCRTRKFLESQIDLDIPRVAALAPSLDLKRAQAHLALIPRICAGGAEAGPIGLLGQAERFHWLVAPQSTSIQVSEVHCGICTDPQATLDDLFTRLVA